MFCPKCGEKIPDGSPFCPKCNHRLSGQPTPAKAATTHAASPAAVATHSSGLSLDAGVIIPLVLGVIALILAFQPWFSPNPSDLRASQYISSGANGISSFFGGSSSAGEAYRLKSTYTMMEIGDYGKTLTAYGEDEGQLFGLLVYVWAIPVIVSAVGLVMAITKRKIGVASVGFVLLAAVGVIMAYISIQVSGPVFPGLCCVVSIATVISLGMMKRA